MPHLYNKNNVNINVHKKWYKQKSNPLGLLNFYVFLQNRTHKSFIILKLCFTSRSLHAYFPNYLPG